MKKQNSLLCGLDPSFRKKGFGMAIIDYSDKTINFTVFKDFLAFYYWFLYDSPAKMTVCVENSNLQKKTFDMKGSKFVVATKSRHVGKNMAISQITVDLMKTKPEYNVIDISPRQKGKKWSLVTALAVMRQEGLTPNKSKITQDEIDSFQIALKGKQLNIFKR